MKIILPILFFLLVLIPFPVNAQQNCTPSLVACSVDCGGVTAWGGQMHNPCGALGPCSATCPAAPAATTTLVPTQVPAADTGGGSGGSGSNCYDTVFSCGYPGCSNPSQSTHVCGGSIVSQGACVCNDPPTATPAGSSGGFTPSSEGIPTPTSRPIRQEPKPTPGTGCYDTVFSCNYTSGYCGNPSQDTRVCGGSIVRQGNCICNDRPVPTPGGNSLPQPVPVSFNGQSPINLLPVAGVVPGQDGSYFATTPDRRQLYYVMSNGELYPMHVQTGNYPVINGAPVGNIPPRPPIPLPTIWALYGWGPDGQPTRDREVIITPNGWNVSGDGTIAYITPVLGPRDPSSSTGDTTRRTNSVGPTIRPCPMKNRGDASCDNLINNGDYELWRAEYLGFQQTRNADFNGDSRVDLLDYEVWRANTYQ